MRESVITLSDYCGINIKGRYDIFRAYECLEITRLEI